MCQQDPEQQSGPGLGIGLGLGPGLGLGSELHHQQHQLSSPTLYDLTYRYLSTRTSNSTVSGTSSSSSGNNVSAPLSSSSSGVTSTNNPLSPQNPPPRTFSKGTLGSSSIGRDSTGPPLVQEGDEEDYEDDFYDYR